MRVSWVGREGRGVQGVRGDGDYEEIEGARARDVLGPAAQPWCGRMGGACRAGGGSRDGCRRFASLRMPCLLGFPGAPAAVRSPASLPQPLLSSHGRGPELPSANIPALHGPS